MAVGSVKPVLPRIRRGSVLVGGLVGALPFTEGRDAPREIVSGTASSLGGTAPAWTGGKHGWCLDFASGNVHLPDGYTNLFRGRVVWTAALWFRADSFATTGTLYEAEDAGFDNFFLQVTSSGLNWGCGGAYRLYTTLAPVAGRWYHVLVEKSGAGDAGTLYLDNVAATPSSGSIATASNVASDLWLGRRPPGGTFTLDGQIDGLHVWDRVLSAAERAALVEDTYQLYERPRPVVRSAVVTTARPSNEDPARGSELVLVAASPSVEWTPEPGKTIDETLFTCTANGAATAVTTVDLGSGRWRSVASSLRLSEDTAYSLVWECETTDANVNAYTHTFSTETEAPQTLTLVEEYVGASDPWAVGLEVAVGQTADPWLVPLEVVVLEGVDGLYESLVTINLLVTVLSEEMGAWLAADAGERADDTLPVSAAVDSDFAEPAALASGAVTALVEDPEVGLAADVYVPSEEITPLSADAGTRADDPFPVSGEASAGYAEITATASLRNEALAAMEDA